MPAGRLQALLDALQASGFRVLGPTLRDGAVCIDELRSTTQLPAGVRTAQSAGHYRTSHSDDPRYFAFHHGADSWKPHLFPARRLLFELNPDLIATSRATPDSPPAAYLGVRACDLGALEIQARVFADADPDYARQLAANFVIGVHCQSAAQTCFCPSTDSGPDFSPSGYLDLTLTELLDEGEHYFVATPHNKRAAKLIEGLNLSEANEQHVGRIAAQLDNTRAEIQTRLPGNARTVLSENPDARHWDDVASRCLACGNCTAVCPTCFCSDVEDQTDLEAQTAQRWQVWDSCFNQGHSYTHAGTVRATIRSRYRQWLTHKLSTWHEQFGTSGCTGCGRCITWCPVGIDLTAEVAAIAAEVVNEG